MDNGRARNGVRDPGPPYAKNIVLVDLHGTIVVPAGGKPQAQLVNEQAEEVLNRKLNSSYKVVARRIRAMRLRMEKIIPPESRFGAAYWGLFNSHFYGCTMEEAVELSRRLTTNPDLYEMPDDRKQFFTWLFEEKFPADRATVMIASNSDRKSVETLLEKIGMRKYFSSDNIFTPDVCGGIGKPSSEYFLRALALKNTDPKKAVIFGNSYTHDVPAVRTGMDVVWLSDEDEIVGKKLVRRNFGPFASRYILRINKIEQARARVDARFVVKK